MRTLRPTPILGLVALALAAGTSCRTPPDPCGGQPATSCEEVAGIWEGRATPTGSTRVLLSVDGETCRVKGSIELSAADRIFAPFDGAMCTASEAELEFRGLVASGEGALTFDPEAKEVTGSVQLTIHREGTDLGRGGVALTIEGIAHQGGGLAETCAERCDDDNPCTDDVCDETLSCVSRNNNTPCDDGDPCTVNDQCIGGTCRSVTPKDCDDENPCTVDACEPATGACTNDPFTSSEPDICDDGNPCTGPDACADGVCVGPDTGACVCGNGTCDPGEDCHDCSADCDFAVGTQAETFCCGDGVVQLPEEADPALCDGNP